MVLMLFLFRLLLNFQGAYALIQVRSLSYIIFLPLHDNHKYNIQVHMRPGK